MKAKTSLTLAGQLLKTLDHLARAGVSRSARILSDFLDRRAQAQRHARAVAALNRHADQLNAEMNDALSFQASAEE